MEEPYDFEYWGKMSTWTLPQAHSLCVGTSPLDPPSISTYDNLINSMSKRQEPLLQNMVRVWLLLKNAYDAFELHDPIKPINFIAWADLHEIDIPGELRDSVERIEQRRASKRTQNDSPAKETALEYIPPYLEFMLLAARETRLSGDKREKIENIMGWLNANWPSGLEGKSNRMIRSMATLLRRPDDKKGGNTRWKKN